MSSLHDASLISRQNAGIETSESCVCFETLVSGMDPEQIWVSTDLRGIYSATMGSTVCRGESLFHWKISKVPHCRMTAKCHRSVSVGAICCFLALLLWCVFRQPGYASLQPWHASLKLWHVCPALMYLQFWHVSPTLMYLSNLDTSPILTCLSNPDVSPVLTCLSNLDVPVQPWHISNLYMHVQPWCASPQLWYTDNSDAFVQPWRLSPTLTWLSNLDVPLFNLDMVVQPWCTALQLWCGCPPWHASLRAWCVFLSKLDMALFNLDVSLSKSNLDVPLCDLDTSHSILDINSSNLHVHLFDLDVSSSTLGLSLFNLDLSPQPQQEPQYGQDEGVSQTTGDKQGPQPVVIQPPPQGKPSYSLQAPPRPVLRSSQHIRGPPGRGPVPSPPNTDPQRPHMIRQQQPLPPQPSHKEAAHVSGREVLSWSKWWWWISL